MRKKTGFLKGVSGLFLDPVIWLGFALVLLCASILAAISMKLRKAKNVIA